METQTLPRWKSHKEVEAFKIYSIQHYPVRDMKDCLAATLYGEFPLVGLPYRVDVRMSYWEKHQPKVGGYYVRYKDGYESYSPAEEFEEGYVPLVAAGVDTGKKTANQAARWEDKQCRDCAYWAKDVPDIIHRKPCLLPSEAKIEMPKVLTHATYSCPDWKRAEVES